MHLMDRSPHASLTKKYVFQKVYDMAALVEGCADRRRHRNFSLVIRDQNAIYLCYRSILDNLLFFIIRLVFDHAVFLTLHHCGPFQR